ncbi:hypothetical protein AGLY_011974 [Aphis glycines]|uniref:Uncharacterized protein n=1 Tax=Aphis glycines TaxID=307491 RepID=A0A6G0TB19_APHGL|nr:hypothetical protein AGLY_011974 [Aphis glycines]
MIRSTHKCKSGKTGKGFVNSLINSHPFEAHCGDKGINPLDTACYDHDILHATRKHLEDRHKVFELRAWERFKTKDTPRKEKIVAYTVINAMKAKRKIGMGCKRKRKRTTKIKINGILLVKKKTLKKKMLSGGKIPLIPIFAGLSAVSSLISGSASEKKLIKRLTDRPLTSRDIIKYIVNFNINHFRGVFSRDDLPKKPRTIECGILNLDVSSGNGSHWVAFYKIKDKVEYFDSFCDLPLPIELQNYFKGNKIKYNYTNYQDFNSFNCGHLCLNFLQCKNHLSGNTTTLSVHYCPPIDVYDDSEIALLNLQTYNTFANINETNNNFEIYLENSDRLLNNNKFPICSITLKKGTTIFSNGIIRFNDLYWGLKKNYEPRMHIDGHRSQKVTNLISVNSIKVMCNIAQGSFNNHMSSHSIYEFSPSENIGSKLIQTPNNLIYYKLNKTNIDSITILLVDQDHNPINNLGEKLIINLHIKLYGS